MHWFDDLSTAMSVKKSRRDAFKLLAGGTAAVALAKLHVAPLPAFAAPDQVAGIAYPPGWNLVSGPAGSTLVGATGSLYSLQPGDDSYEQFPASSPLRACWGYWAFFPAGGSLTPGTSSASCVTALQPGAWAMIGNPSIGGAATVTPAVDSLLTYTPAAGYQQVSAIPVGAGAFVTGSQAITTSTALPAVAPPAAVPVATVAPVPTRAPTAAPTAAPPATSTCCRVCTTGCACGASCISCRDTCHAGPGCAC